MLSASDPQTRAFEAQLEQEALQKRLELKKQQLQQQEVDASKGASKKLEYQDRWSTQGQMSQSQQNLNQVLKKIGS